MPQVGEISKGHQIGKKTNMKCIWHACIDCGEGRWVQLNKERPVHNVCNSCSAKRKVNKGIFKGENNPAWKGGKYKDARGYVLVWLKLSNPFYPMAQAKHGYVKEHRLIMAKHLGRCLQRQEVVHHKNGVRDDNRLENLQLFASVTLHNSLPKYRVQQLHKEISELKQLIEEQTKQIKLLQWQLRDAGVINQV